MAKQQEKRKQKPDTRRVSESELAGMTVAELRVKASDLGVSGIHSLRKDDLVHAVAEAMGSTGKRGAPRPRREGDSGGGVRRGKESSKSMKYAQEVTSTGDEPERPGRSLATTSHDVIRQWAERRDAAPATVEGTEHDDLGVLRFDFPGFGGEELRRVGWDEWFDTFDQRGLNFVYQEERSDGSQSNFFRLENPDREDA